MRPMKYAHILPVIASLIMFSCSKNTDNFIEHLSGYWEIERVIMKDGTKREFKINQMIDYIFIDDSLTGFRKKLQPNFQGTYTGSDDTEVFKLTKDNNTLKITYTTDLNTWTETIIFANSNTLIIKNDAEITYEYKRYQPITIE